MDKYPKIKSVIPLKDRVIEVIFESGEKKLYDCSLIMNEKPFDMLNDNFIFNNVHVESGGYGVSWNNEIDLSESELWINGKSI